MNKQNIEKLIHELRLNSDLKGYFECRYVLSKERDDEKFSREKYQEHNRIAEVLSAQLLAAFDQEQEEQPAPCPFCENKDVITIELMSGRFCVYCPDVDCESYGPRRSTRHEAIIAWNKVARRD